MAELKIAVCVKPVPDSDHYDKMSLDPVTKTLIRAGIPIEINPTDKHAMELALKLKEQNGGKITVFSMAPEDTKDKLLEVLAMGADESVILSDREFAGADTVATSYTLAEGIKKTGEFDLVITGNESSDGGTAHVCAQLGEWLEVPHLMNVIGFEYDGTKAEVKTKIESGCMKYELQLPAVIGASHELNAPRHTNVMGMLKAKSKPITVINAEELGANKDFLGLLGSPTQPGEIFMPNMDRGSEEITGEIEEIADQIVTIIKKSGIAY